MSGWLADAVRAVRGLRKQPTFSAVAVLTVALGVGANALAFSVVKAVLLDPLPYAEADRLVAVSGVRMSTGSDYPLSHLDIRDLGRDLSGFDGLVARTGARSFNLLSDGASENVNGELVESRYFEFLGIGPLHGRLFTEAEDLEGEHRVVVLSHGLWSRSFGGDESVVGTAIELDGRTFEVVGVAPPSFSGMTGQADVWLPLTMAPSLYQPFYLAARQFRWLSALGRLSPGVSSEAGQQALARGAAALRDTHTQENHEVDVRAVSLPDHFFGEIRPRLLLLWGASAFVLLIAAANLAALLLARGTARGNEVALRSALGAGRLNLAAGELAEGFAIAVAGVVVGLGGASLVLRPLIDATAVELPGFVAPDMDLRVVMVMVAVSVAAALLASSVPAYLASRTSAVAAMTRQGRGVALSRGRARMLSSFVVVQVAVAVVLVAGVGLSADGFRRLVGVDPGFDARDVAMARVDLKAPRFEPNEAYWGFASELRERALRLPDVGGAALVGPQPPVGEWNSVEVSVEARTGAGLDPNGLVAVSHSVSPEYFAVMGIPLLEGRDFAATDRDPSSSELVMVINRSFAERYFTGSPVGQTVNLGRPDQNGPPVTVIGVVGDVMDGGPGAEARPSDLQVYFSVYQMTPRLPPALNLVVRSSGRASSPGALLPALRTLNDEWAPDAPLFRVATLESLIDRQVATQRFLVWIMTGFAGLAVGLAIVGLYGVVTYTVGRRTAEFGVRLALGAAPAGVLRLVLAQSMRLVLAGVALGLGVAAVAGRALEAGLDTVEVLNPVVYLASAGLVLTVAVVSAAVPAARAARTSPLTSLQGMS